MKKYFLFIGAVLVFAVIASEVEAEWRYFHREKVPRLEHWNGTVGVESDTAGGITGVKLSSGSAPKNAAQINRTDYLGYFFNKPLNGTFLGYLGASHLMVNWSGRPTVGDSCGACTLDQSSRVFSTPSVSGNEQIFAEFDDEATNSVIFMIGGSTKEVTLASYSANYFNFSALVNYTRGWTNFSAIRYDGVGKVEASIGAVYNQRGVFNITHALTYAASGIGMTNPSGTIAEVYILSDFDADYFNSGKNYTFIPNHSQVYLDEDNVNLSIIAPIPVNASYRFGSGNFTSLCENCLNFSAIISTTVGLHNITFNYSFNKGPETFWRFETHTFSSGQQYQDCAESVSGFNVPVMNINFRREASPTTSVSSNFTIRILSGSEVIYTTSKNAQTSFSLCSTNTTESFSRGYQLVYISTDGTYSLREHNSDALQLNSTNATNINAYQILDAVASNFVVTLTDTAGATLADYVVEAIKLSGTSTDELMVASYRTSSNGQAVFPLDLTGTGDKYKFKVYRSGVLIEETSFETLTSTSKNIKIELPQDLIVQTEIAIRQNVTYNLTFDSIQNVTGTWNDTTGGTLVSMGCLTVKRISNVNASLETTQETCRVGSNGTIIIAVPTNQSAYIGYLSVLGVPDGVFHLLDDIFIPGQREFSVYGREGLFWATMGFMSIGAYGLMFDWVTAVALALFAILGFSAFGIVGMTQSSVMGIVTIVVIVVFYLARGTKK